MFIFKNHFGKGVNGLKNGSKHLGLIYENQLTGMEKDFHSTLIRQSFG